MGLKQVLKLTTAAAVSLTLVAGATTSANAVEKLKWKMQSAFGGKLSIIGEAPVRFEKQIMAMSGGAMKIKFFEPGALIPVLQGWDAVKAGSIDVMWGTAGYHVGKIPALSFFSAVPFGPRAGEFLAWLEYGGGDEIYNRIYAENGMIGLHCVAIAPETSGWFRKKYNSVAELKGLKMRFFGLGAVVMTKLGVSTQLLPGADIYPALERGVIDATEFSMPSIDYDLGFYQIAKFNYYPGWHQQSSLGEMLMNKAAWEGLSDQQRAIIKGGCGETLAWSFVRSEAKQPEAMAKLKAKGVTNVRWSDADLKLMENAWKEVVAEESAKDPLFKEVYTSYASFREKFKVWKDNGYID
ncbi:MAG: TRAP transporter substrate-binding protein [Alphaproteobacteria bacterium]|nr:TRAP transporter substrate-binding protein [Alphaproteobacteria bacterium]